MTADADLDRRPGSEFFDRTWTLARPIEDEGDRAILEADLATIVTRTGVCAVGREC